MSKTVEECFTILSQLSERLKEIEGDIETKEKLVHEKAIDLEQREMQLITEKHELESYNKVSYYNKLNKQIAVLENENRILKRSQELRNLNRNSENNATKHYLNSSIGAIDSSIIEALGTTSSHDNISTDKTSLEIEQKLVKEINTLDNDSLDEQEKDNDQDVSIEIDVSNEGGHDGPDSDEELEKVLHEGKQYHTDNIYLYDMVSGDAVAYKRGQDFKFYKKSKKK